MIWLQNSMAAIVIVSLVVAASSDIATRTIPNSSAAIVAVTGVAARLLTGPSSAAVSLAASAALGVFLLLFYTRGLLGGGDVKLIPAITVGLSLSSINLFVFVTVIAGGVLAVFHLLARRASRHWPPSPAPRGASVLRRIFCAERWRVARHGSLPYGVAIACGGIWVIISKAGN